MKQYYTTLGLEEGASQEEIKEAYNRFELDFANKDNEDFFKDEYQKVKAAYKALYNTSNLGIEKGAKDSKKEQPQLKEKKTIKKRFSIIQWVLVLLGSIISGGLFSFLFSVYYFKDATIKVFIYNVLNINVVSSLVADNIIYNFLIGFFTFIFLFVLIKKYLKFNFKKSKKKKIKPPKKRVSKRDFIFGFLLFSIAIGIWVLVLQNMDVF